MNVTLNGEPAELPAGATIATVLERLDLEAAAREVAVAVDAEVVPRGTWAQERLTDGAQVEVLHAVQGG